MSEQMLGEQGPVALQTLAEVISTSPPGSLQARLSEGIELSTGLKLPITIDASVPKRIKLCSTEKISLQSLAVFGDLLTETARGALVPPELGALERLELTRVELLINTATRSIDRLELELGYRLDWDIGRAALGRPGLLVLRQLAAHVELDSPLDPSRLIFATLRGGLQLGSGRLSFGLNIGDLTLFADLEEGSRLSLRELAPLFSLETIPDGLETLAISELELELGIRRRAGSLRLRLSSDWRLEVGERHLAVRNVFLGLAHEPGRGPSGRIEGKLELAGIALTLAAEVQPGGAWTFEGKLAGDTAGDSETSPTRLKLSQLLESFLQEAGMPVELPDIEFSTLDLSVTPTTGAVRVCCEASVDLPLGGTHLKISSAKFLLERQSKQEGTQVLLSLTCSGNIEDVVSFERFHLTLSFDTLKRHWALEGALKADLLGHSLDLNASLFRGAEESGFRLAARQTWVTLPLQGLPDGELSLGFRHFDLVRTPAGWTARAAASLKLRGLPAPLSTLLPAQLDVDCHFSGGNMTLGLSRLLAPQRFRLPDIEAPGARKVELGEMLIDLRALNFTLGRQLAFSGTLALGLPSKLNNLFGVKQDGKPGTKVFRCYDPERPEESLVKVELGFELASGLFARLLTPPFECVTVQGNHWTVDLGEAGGFELDVPVLRSNGAGFSCGGGLRIQEKGLFIPLTPIKNLFQLAGLPDAVKAVPDRVRIDKIDLLDSKGRLSLPHLLGTEPKDIPSELQPLLDFLGDLTERLPGRLQKFFSFQIQSLSFAFSMDASGSLSLNVETARNAPIRFMLPGCPSITCVELRRLAFGPLFGGSLFRLDVDADIDVFDFATILCSLALPDELMGRELPARSALQRTLHLNDLFLVIVYQTGIPIPLPLLYTKLGFSYVGIEGIRTALHLYFNSPRPKEGKPQLDLGEALRVLQSLKRFFMERDYLLSTAAEPQKMNLVFQVEQAYLELPSYLGGGVLGTKDAVELLNVYKVVAGVLDTLKTGSPRYLLQATPLKHRIGEVRLKVANVLELRAGWALVTLAECEARWDEVRGMLDQGSDAPAPELSTGTVRALLPAGSALVLGGSALAGTPDPDGLLVVLRGGFDMEGIVRWDALFLLKASGVSGFATALRFSARIAQALEVELQGLLRISPKEPDNAFQLAGASRLSFLGRQVLAGAFSVGSDHFALEGALDLFPPEAPLAVRGQVRGVFTRQQFLLKGSAEVSVLCFPLLAGEIDIFSGLEGQERINRFRLSTTLLGATLSLDIRQEHNALVARGGCSPIHLGPLLSIVRSHDNQAEGPFALLRQEGGQTSFELEGMISFLGLMSQQAKLRVSPEAVLFNLEGRFLGDAGRMALDCQWRPEHGLWANASFSLGIHQEQQVSLTGPDGKTEQKRLVLQTGVEVTLGIQVERWLEVDRPEERLLPHLKLIERQRSLFGARERLGGLVLPAGELAVEVASRLARVRPGLDALREQLWQVRELHLYLTVPNDAWRLPVSRLPDYRAAVNETLRQLDALAAELGALGQALPGEEALWHRLRADLASLRQAASSGSKAAVALEGEETAFHRHFEERLRALLAPGLAPAARRTRVRALVEALHARALYPEAPWEEREGIAAVSDGLTARYVARLSSKLTALASQATARDESRLALLARSAAARSRVNDMRAAVLQSEDVANRLVSLEARARQRGSLQAPVAHAPEHLVQGLAEVESVLQSIRADIVWVVEHLESRRWRDELDARLRVLRERCEALGKQKRLRDTNPTAQLATSMEQLEQARTQARLLVQALPALGSPEGQGDLQFLESLVEKRAYLQGEAERNVALKPEVSRIEAGLQECEARLQARFEPWLAMVLANERTPLNDALSAFVANEAAVTTGHREVLALLDLRPLDGMRLPFVGLATPDSPPEMAMRPAPLATRDDQVAFGMSLGLDFLHEGKRFQMAGVYLTTPPTRLVEELPGMIAAEMARQVLGIPNEVQWLDNRLMRHARQRTLRQRHLEDLARVLQLYHGMPAETATALTVA
jgi:hypothetical protein